MRKKLVISSGKGGVGKSMLTSALAMLFSKKTKIVAIDCDVDAPNLSIWLNEDRDWQAVKKISTSAKAVVDRNKCDNCGLCVKECRFNAMKIVNRKLEISPFLCEGCGVCEIVCPKNAIHLEPVKNGEIKIKKTKYGFPLVVGQLYPGETGSGKIVSEIKKQAENFNSDLMVIDSSPGTGCPVIAAVRDADFVVSVVEPTPPGFSDLKRGLKVVDYFKIPYSVVINKWDVNPEMAEHIKKWAKDKFLGKISYNQEIFKAVSSLTPILETDLETKQEIKSIFDKLVESFS